MKKVTTDEVYKFTLRKNNDFHIYVKFSKCKSCFQTDLEIQLNHLSFRYL